MFHSVFLDILSILCGLYGDDNSGMSFKIIVEYLLLYICRGTTMIRHRNEIFNEEIRNG